MPSDVRSHRQTILPKTYTYVVNTQETTMRSRTFDSWGKHQGSIIIDNKANQAVVVKLFGLRATQANDADPAEKYQIGANISVGAAARGYETFADPFPFYMVQKTYAVAPTDGSPQDLTIELHLVH